MRTVTEILDDACARTGWDTDSVVAVLSDWIQCQHREAEFAAYVAERVAEELEAGVEAAE